MTQSFCKQSPVGYRNRIYEQKSASLFRFNLQNDLSRAPERLSLTRKPSLVENLNNSRQRSIPHPHLMHQHITMYRDHHIRSRHVFDDLILFHIAEIVDVNVGDVEEGFE